MQDLALGYLRGVTFLVAPLDIGQKAIPVPVACE